MITVICQYTGIEFEAESKRSKNHPQVAAFLNAANEDGKRSVGAYPKAKELLAEAAGNFDNIDELMAAVNAAYADWQTGAPSKSVMSYKERVARGDRYARSVVANMHRNEENDGYVMPATQPNFDEELS